MEFLVSVTALLGVVSEVELCCSDKVDCEVKGLFALFSVDLETGALCSGVSFVVSTFFSELVCNVFGVETFCSVVSIVVSVDVDVSFVSSEDESSLSGLCDLATPKISASKPAPITVSLFLGYDVPIFVYNKVLSIEMDGRFVCSLCKGLFCLCKKKNRSK